MTEATALQPSVIGRAEKTRPFGWRNRVIGLEYHRPNEILDHPHQWRVHPDKQLAVLRGVLGDIGIAGALLVYQSIRANGALVSIDGHGRKKLDPSCDWPCLMLDLTDTEADVLLSTFDPVGAMALVDCEKLNLLLAATPVKNADLAAMLKKLQAERPSILGAPVTQDPGAQTDRAAELQKKWRTKQGQLWQVGRHRLLCGDSTKAENAARVMGNEKINVCVTDPPYGMGLDTDWSGIRGTGRSLGFQKSVRGKAYAPVHGDDKPFDPQPVFDLWGHEVAEMFLFGADYYAERIPNRSNGSWLVWDKRKESQADGFGSEFELIWSRSKHKRRILRHEWFGFLREGEHGESRTHPTQKPVALIADLLLQWSSPDSLVSDPYLGSGTTMVAAEQLGRICYGMEIEPKYVAVSLERMAGMGLEPKLVEP